MDPTLNHGTFSCQPQKETWKHVALLSFQTLGVVYGHLSTAPLYVFGTIPQEDFKSDEIPYQFLSFIFWTITIISLLKYALIVLIADDDGEGGTFALYSLLCRHAKVGLLPNDQLTDETVHLVETSSKMKWRSKARRALEKHRFSHYLMLFLALFGSCMIINDGVLTPAISVLSASKGVKRSLSEIVNSSSSLNTSRDSITKALDKYVPVPSACIIQIVLFMLQQYGTDKIGFLFAPIITIWLLFIGGVGLYNILHFNPNILHAISPAYMYSFVRNINKHSWRSLGSILLCIAGSEAMFANLGHFSKTSIKITFVCCIYPVLLVSYAGQAAFISRNWHIVPEFNHLSSSMPDHTRHAFVVLSLFASAVGSQASITASFSIINQLLALKCFPQVKVVHTSEKIHGQVYIADLNWLLMILSLSVTIGLHKVGPIGYATGMAIVSGMLVTTCLMSLVISVYWEKSLFISACFLIFFGFIEAMYLSACIWNFHLGAWYLVMLSVLFLTIMLVWHYGSMKEYEFDLENKVSFEWLTDFGAGLGISRVPGIGFIYTDIVTGVPAFFSHFIANLPAFHQVLIFVSFKPQPLPYVPSNQWFLINRVGHKDYRIYRCIVRYGYCDRTRDTDDFEEQIIHSIGEFISLEEKDFESITFEEGKMTIGGKPGSDGRAAYALIPVNNSMSTASSSRTSEENMTVSYHPGSEKGPSTNAPVRRKKVRFVLPPESPKMQAFVRDELQQLVDARESGTAYILGQSHIVARQGSNFFKRLVIMVYVLLDRNSREPPVALNIPHAALIEVGMVYTI